MGTKLTDMTKQLVKFLSSSSSSVLLKETNGISDISIIEAQIQKRRLENDEHGMAALLDSSVEDINCLNILNVAVAEKNRRRGLFTDFLALLEGFDYGPYFDKCSSFYIRVDKVMNPVLDECLPRKGYTRTLAGNETHYSYHKAIRRKNDIITLHPAAKLASFPTQGPCPQYDFYMESQDEHFLRSLKNRG